MTEGRAMLFTYADPPYLGQSRHYDHDDAKRYDRLSGHLELIERLQDESPDGWALSLSSPSLRAILPLCPDNCRVGAWVKPFCSFKPGTRVQYAWEPVIFRGGRAPHQSVRDWLACPITTQRGVVGAKPENFCFWLFTLAGLRPGDTLVDLFPGSGAVTQAWDTYTRLHDGLFAPATGGVA